MDAARPPPSARPVAVHPAAFGAAVGTNIVVGLAMAGLGLLAFTFLQTVHDLSPLRAGLVALPTIAGSIAGTAVAARLGGRIRPATLVVVGFGLTAGGLAGVGQLDPDTHVAVFITGYTVLTLGIGILGTLANTLVLDTAPTERASSAAGTSETGMVLGEALGIALFGTVSAAIYQRLMARDPGIALPDGAGNTVAGDVGIARQLPADEAATLIDAAHEAFTSGFTTVSTTAAVLLTCAAVAAAVALRRVPARG
ncbi:MFS transporter [Saccharomonospora sp. CUA-673]|uniref:MFS transporter n=1 Tax=Saccharomonospora sp. CUA-673 TaxID=1904969 RepID=UPI001C9E317F|nr:MFS transporter [Saccharomonospora sp. CUA-673]